MTRRGGPPNVRLLDEQTQPSVRQLIGGSLKRSLTADFALTRIRLATLDLAEEEMKGPRRCRVLLGQLDAAALLDRASGARGPSIGGLLDWLSSGRLEVRSAGIGGWTPDFSLFETADGSRTALLGAHYFGTAPLSTGPSFTAVMSDPGSCARLAVRFEEVWERAHDVAPAIADVLERAERDAVGATSRP